MLWSRVVNCGNEEWQTDLCYILKVNLTEFSNAENEKKNHLPA